MRPYWLPHGLNMLIPGLCTVIVVSIFIRMSFSYTHKRANQQYAIGKTPAPSIRVFRTLSKILFISSMLMCVISYWIQTPFLLQIASNPWSQMIGASLCLWGYLNLERAFSTLGDHYSPLFDAYLPDQLITTGPYQNIRHPIYLYNLFVSFGLALSSLSLLITINAFVGLAFVLKAIALEEKYLAEHFPRYHQYQQQSWRLIPYIF